MKSIAQTHLNALALGAILLGSGGGGSTAILYGLLHYLLQERSIQLLDVSELSANQLVVPIAMVGAPLVSLERIPSSRMFGELIAAIRAYFPKKELVLMPAEIGGCNALSALVAAAKSHLPVLDGDLIGRAFPEVGMCKPAVMANAEQTSFVVDAVGNVTMIKTNSIKQLEESVRELTVKLGCSVVVATFLFDSQEQKNYVIPGSLMRARRLGKLAEHYNKKSFSEKFAKFLVSGFVTDVCYRIENGFLLGYLNLKTSDDTIQVVFKNEFLLVLNTHSKNILAETPDIICIIESSSGIPLTSETIQYGMHVDLFSLPAPDFWQQPFAKQYVNLQSMGLNLGEKTYA